MMRYLPITCVLFYLAACNAPKKEELPFYSYNLDEVTTAIDIPLAKLMEDMEVVTLETTEDTYLPENFKYIVGDQYIATVDNEKLLLFSRDGSFIKRIATAGRGPQEYLGRPSMLFGPEEKYLHVSNQKAIRAFPLEAGEYQEIKVPGGNNQLVLNEENRILTVGSQMDSVRSVSIDLTSNNVFDIVYRKPIMRVEGGYVWPRATFLSTLNGASYYQVAGNDTLYQKNQSSWTPYFEIKVDKPMIDMLSGSHPQIQLINPQYVLIKLTTYDVPNGNMGSYRLFALNRNENIMFEVEVADELKGEELNPYFRLQKSGDWISLYYDAATWTDFRDNGTMDLLPDRLFEETKDLSMEDNPVLVIGKLKE